MARYLIIAASSGIGAATCEVLRAAGHEVLTTARDAAHGAPWISGQVLGIDGGLSHVHPKQRG